MRNSNTARDLKDQSQTKGLDGKSDGSGLGVSKYNQFILNKSLPAQSQSVSNVLHQLLFAFNLAVDCDRDRWDFAIEYDRICDSGISREELRWLQSKHYIEHAYEIDGPDQSKRTFYSKGSPVFAQQSCFTISDTGIAFLETLQSKSLTISPPTELVDAPKWDHKSRVLSFGNVPVKRFKWRAANQEKILQAFQEENWPTQIDDPLPQSEDVDPKRRLNDAIKSLNSNQQNELIRFHGDGTGQGITWSARYHAKS